MKKMTFLFLVLCALAGQTVVVEAALSVETRRAILEQVGLALPELASYPRMRYPNSKHAQLLEHFPDGKVPIFGYGSLINKVSAGRSVKPEALDTMRPVIAFGAKRLFGYNARASERWGVLDPKERAMLNIVPSWNLTDRVNGVVLEVDAEDLASLVEREVGYDLVPILVATWNDDHEADPVLNLEVAYTFSASSELRDNVLYTATQFYPVRGYLKAVRDGAAEFGETFARFWEATTFLGNGTTSVDEWDEKTFRDILCTHPPYKE